MAPRALRVPRIPRPGKDALQLGLGCTIAGFALGCALLFTPLWYVLEFRIFDLFSIYTAPLRTEMPITIVGIDEASSAQLDQGWPYPRSLHADLIEKLNAAGAAVVAFDVQFSEPSDPDEDQRFAQAIAGAGNVVLASKYEYHETASTRVFMRMDPLPLFTQAGARAGLTDMELVGDQVPRRMALGEDAFWRVAIRTLVEVMPDAGIVEPGVPDRAMIRYLGPRNTFPIVSYYQVINQDPDIQESLAGAMVLVGRDAGATTDINVAQADSFPTPFTLTTGLMSSGVEIHATQMENALLNTMLEPASRTLNLAVLGVTMLLALPWLVWWHPARSAAGVIGCIGLSTGFAFLMFGHGICDGGSPLALLTEDCSAKGGVLRHFWMASAAPAAGVVAAFIGTGTGSFLTERRRAARIRNAFAMYVSGDVVQQMIAHPEKLRLGGERREITVLFSDLAGFTHLSEKLDPDAISRVVNTYLNAMTQVIMRNGGTVDKFIGDAVMAVFGLPQPGDDDADRAVRTSLSMLTSLQSFNQARGEEGLLPIRIGIGLHTDAVVSGNIGSPKRMNYTVIGDGVNLAARLESACKQYGAQLLISESTRSRLRGTYRMREADRVVVKGKTEPVLIHELLDFHDEASFPHLVEVLGHYRDGLERYRAGRFKQALASFAEALALNPNDKLSSLYSGRCEHYLAEPPGNDWDGIWVLKEK